MCDSFMKIAVLPQITRDGAFKTIIFQRMNEAITSDMVREWQVTLAEAAQAYLAHYGISKAQSEMPDALLKRVQQLWEQPGPEPDYIQNKEMPLISIKQVVMRGVYSPKRIHGADNEGYLKRWDPQLLGLAQALVEDHVYAYYLDTLAKKHGAANESTQEAIEQMRLQTNEHYVTLLEEKGYRSEDAIKWVGHAVKAAMIIAQRLDLDVSIIHPQHRSYSDRLLTRHRIRFFAEDARDSFAASRNGLSR